MFEIYPKLWIGSQKDCTYDLHLPVLHCAKSPCHQQALNYKKSLDKKHPHYLHYQYQNHLFLNIIDGDKPLFYIETFTKALDFISQNIHEEMLLIHCNHAQSRSPSIGLLFLAKVAQKISNENFEKAMQDFVKIYPLYNPRPGIKQFLQTNWSIIE